MCFGYYTVAGVNRSRACDIGGSASAVGRKAAGLCIGDGRAATQLRRRYKVGSAEAHRCHRERTSSSGGRRLRRGCTASRRVQQDRLAASRSKRSDRKCSGRVGTPPTAVAAVHDAGAGHPEEYT